MTDLVHICSMLGSDLRSLAEMLLIFGVLCLVPASLVGLIAAEATRSTWRDVPLGIFWSLAAGVPTLLAALGLCVGMLSFNRSGQDWGLLVLIYGASALVAIGAGYCSAVSYYVGRMKQRTAGDSLESQPTTQRFSFSLRKLLLIQVAFLFVFGFWLSVRRDELEHQRQETQKRTGWREALERQLAEQEAYQQRVVSRFARYGWNILKSDDEGLSMIHTEPTLTGFRDEVLAQIEPADHLARLTVRSDDLTDFGLELICRNADLKELEIQSEYITDRGITHLVKLKKLEKLRISCPRLTEESLNDLVRLESLEQLTFYNSKIARRRRGDFKLVRPDVKIQIFPDP